MHVLVKLAKDTVENYVRNKTIITPPHLTLPSEVPGKAGVFVSIKKKGQLRGCIGTYTSQNDTIITEIMVNAISAATRDPRFQPVKEEELSDLTYSLDVLSELEKVDSKDELDPKIYGVVVVKGSQRGLLLPALEGVDTVEEQIRISKIKAGISGGDVELYRFKVMRYK